MSMKIWHDDVRPAPPGWVWVQNNEDARAIISACFPSITEISMDHDLGAVPYGEAGIMARGWAEETGYKLAMWMAKTGFLPPKVTIHSWNPDGAKKMASVFFQADPELDVTIRPFNPIELGPGYDDYI